jgi:hypothetical protein
MAIEDDIVALLQSPEVQKIRFVAEAIRIGGDRYKAVAKKLKEGLVTVDIDPDLDDDDDNPRDGKYNPHTDTVTLMKDALVTTDDKRIAVHEMTHAVIDDLNLPRSRGLSHYEAEGIAYIAAALYIRFVNGPAIDDTDDAHVQVADAIAKNVIAAGHTLYVATPNEMRRLRRAIGKDPLYAAHADHPQFSDGI